MLLSPPFSSSSLLKLSEHLYYSYIMSHHYYTGCSEHHEPHFLESCNLCSKPLGYNSDIFMYRGNTPFCSKECRQEQIDMDEANERKGWKSSSRSLRKSEQSTNNESTPSSTVVVA